ncbi:MAG: late competence development ComFB family protein [Lachnospiraceae bacterium]|nr:late competence development ComFB family protein [Lachnospiraceae bacterium]
MSLIVKNMMEDMVERKLDQMLPQLDVCSCEICRTDIICYALNRLKPKYVATSQGELLSKLDELSSTFDMSIVTQITTAAQIVKEFPRHGVK